MKPHEIEGLIYGRALEIKTAAVAAAELEERKAFAHEAATKLNYKPVEQAMKQETIAVPCDVVLLKGLQSLGIRPFDRAAVRRYERAMAGNRLNMLLKLFGIPMFCAGFVISASLMLWNRPALSTAPGAVWAWIFGVGCFLTWAEHVLVHRREWQTTPLQHSWTFDGKSLVPRSVLELALRVQKACPGVVFYVRHLERDHGHWFYWFSWMESLPWSGSSMDPDPFLEVRSAGESYVIAVWDEPGFDGKMIEVE